MPDLSAALAGADPETRHALYEAFRLRVEIDRNPGQIRLKALVSSAFSEIKGLSLPPLRGANPSLISNRPRNPPHFGHECPGCVGYAGYVPIPSDYEWLRPPGQS